ncbi:MAG TPA: PDZ domain-containing protein [Vicinamibacterales bacterium]|nr:PDZ domain-containing protein [Vicinamibacterales bacterium]
MTSGTAAGLAAAFIIAAGASASLGPVAHAQDRRADSGRARTRIVRLLAGGPQIGVTVRDAESGDASEGAVVESVETDSPAERAGIQSGDVVTRFDGERVRSAREFERLVQETPPGRKVEATVLRQGQQTKITVTPDVNDVFSSLKRTPGWRGGSGSFDWVAPPSPPAAPLPPSPPGFMFRYETEGGRLGVTVEDLSPQLRDFFGAKAGVLVRSVQDGSAAQKAGVRAGDVITGINDASIESTSDLRHAVGGLEAGAVAIEIVRDRKSQRLNGTIETGRGDRGRIISGAD